MFQAWSNLAGVYMMNRSFSKAIDCFEKDVSISPNRSDQWRMYANALWSLDRKAEAIEKCRHALELNPSDPYAARNLAYMLKDAGRSEEAQKVLEKASRFTKDGGEILEPLEPRY
jgi:tetratricopeptide (TPR) repeat protein